MVSTRSNAASDTCCLGPPGPASVGVSHQNGLGKTGDEYRPGSSPAPPRQMLRAHTPNTQTNTLKIFQNNMQGAKHVTDEITKEIGKQGVSLLLAQEIYNAQQNGSYTFVGLGTGRIVAADRKGKPKVAAVSFNSGIKLNLLSQFSNPHCVCAEVLAQGFSFYVVSQYFQYKDDRRIHIEYLDRILGSLKNKKVLIAADVNSRSLLWGPSEDENGKLIEDLIIKHNLVVLNNPNKGPTFETTNGISYIDVTLATPALIPMILNWDVKTKLTTGDHKVIEIEIGAPSGISRENLEPARFCLAKADWNKFSEHFKSQTESWMEAAIPRNPSEAKALATEMTNIIKQSCEIAIPRKRFFIKSNPWWSRELTIWKRIVHRAKREYRKLRKAHRTCDCPNCKKVRENLKKILRKYSHLIAKTKRASLRDFITADANEKPWGFSYKLAAGKLRNDSALNTLRTKTGYTISMEETAKKLINAHIPDDRVDLDSPEQKQTRGNTHVRPDTNNCPPFTVHELKRTIRSFKNGKAPGLDLIEVKALKIAFKANAEPFLKLFNTLLEHGVFPDEWKEGSLRLIRKGDKDPEEPGSYRPLCLLSTLGKWYEKLIKLRLEESVMTADKISDKQYGFTRNKSAEDAIIHMRKIVKESNENHTVGILFDIKGAFDNVWWPLVLEELRERQCPQNIYNVIHNYFENRKVTLSWGSGKVSKTPTKGCPQGSVLGPSLWNIQFDALLRKLDEAQIEYVVYADDLIVILKESSREKVEKKGQAVVDLITSWCKYATLQVSESKTEAIYLKKLDQKLSCGKDGKGKRRRTQNKNKNQKCSSKTTRDPIIKINDNKIMFKSTVKYLGVNFDTCLGIKTHCEKLRGRMLRMFNDLKRMSGAYWGIKFPASKIIYKGVFIPTVTYAAGGWWDLCNEKMKGKIVSAQRSALLAMTRAYSTTSNEALQVIAGTLPGDLEVDMAVARYNLRKSGETNFLGQEIILERGDKISELKPIAYDKWQSRWENSEKGRETYQFFKNVKERSNMSWFHPSHNLVQVVSGHGNFRQYLKKRNIIQDEMCECGLGPDNPIHLIFECQRWEAIRNSLAGTVSEATWTEMKETPNLLVSKSDICTVFTDFCNEVMYIKSCEECFSESN